MTQTVLILGGNGKIGSHAAKAFEAIGWNVRQYDRKSGDMLYAARGVDVIVNGLNPPKYHDWANTIPAITSQVIEAAKTSGASVILPGNIYNFGPQSGELNEFTPHRPNTMKGRIRVEMEQAYRSSGIQTITLRAGNFIDPLGNGDIMSLLIMREAAKFKLSDAGGSNTRQAYAYVPDWARAAAQLAEKRTELAQFEDIPFPGHAFTLAELKAELDQATGQTFRLSRFPWWMMTMISPFVEVARELREMRYLYELNHWIGSDKFYRILPGFKPTDMASVMRAGLPSNINPNQTMRASSKAIAAQ
jgi:nucleoside-diphosphate-sugar epimerase